MKDLAAFERLVRLFTAMAWLGAAAIVGGIALGAAAQGSGGAAVVGDAVGGGGISIFVGLRERRKGNRLLRDARNEAQGNHGGA